MFDMNLFDQILYDGTGKKTIDVTAVFSFAGTVDSSLDIGIAFGPGSYTLDKSHPLFKIVSRGLQNKRLYYQSEEVIPNVVVVLPKKEKQNNRVSIVNIQKSYLKATVPISKFAYEDVKHNVSVSRIAYNHDEPKVKVVHSCDESINNMLNIYSETFFAKELPSAIASFGKKFEAKQNNKDFGVKRFNDFEIEKPEKTVYVRR
jgi:hypothetical protein